MAVSWCCIVVTPIRRARPEDALAEVRTRIATGVFVPPDKRRHEEAFVRRPVLFAAFIEAKYLPWSKVEHSAKHHDVQKWMLSAHIIPYFKGYNLHEITAKRIEDYKPLRLRKVSKATTNRELFCLKKALGKVVDWGWLEESPAQGVKGFKETPKVLRLLEMEEIAALLSQCREEPCPVSLYALIATVAYAGLRRSEILNMRWDWIDFRREQITVRPSTDWHPKNYKPRTIPMNPELVEALRQAPRRLVYPLAFQTPGGTVYKNIHWIEQALDRAAKRAGIEDGVGLHQLRHGFCSHAQMQGVDPRTVQGWLGHQDLRTTLRYSHTSPEHERAAIRAFRYESRHQQGTGTA